MSALLSDILPSYKLKPASSWECSLSQSQSKDKGTSSINPKGIRARNLPFCVTKTSLLKWIHESFNLGGGVGQQVFSGRNLTQHSTAECRLSTASPKCTGRASEPGLSSGKEMLWSEVLRPPANLPRCILHLLWTTDKHPSFPARSRAAVKLLAAGFFLQWTNFMSFRFEKVRFRLGSNQIVVR